MPFVVPWVFPGLGLRDPSRKRERSLHPRLWAVSVSPFAFSMCANAAVSATIRPRTSSLCALPIQKEELAPCTRGNVGTVLNHHVNLEAHKRDQRRYGESHAATYR